VLTHAEWERVPGLRHGFLDARDSRAAPHWDQALAAQGIYVALARPRQVHGATVLLAERATPSVEGDAVVATRRGIAVGIVTADCTPLLLRDRRGRAVAAVHAGWRGAAAGVLEATLDVLARTAGVDASDVEVVLGPAASGCCYEVQDDVRRAFGDRVAHAFVPRGDSFLFDLRAAVARLAEDAGVASVTRLGPCTVCDRAWASYRRDGAAAGRQLSFIALT
jgi:YfiH family protein